MSLNHAILGFLNYRAITGYDLKKVFDVSVWHFWPADQNQIYRTLGQLESHQWVKMERVRQKEHPDCKVYHITDASRKELRRWLTVALSLTEFHDPAQVQFFIAGQLKDQEILEMFERSAYVQTSSRSGAMSLPESLEPPSNLFESRRGFHMCFEIRIAGAIGRQRNRQAAVETTIHQQTGNDGPIGSIDLLCW